MTAIFLCDRTNELFQIYAPDCFSKLKELTKIEKKIYTRADIIAEPSRFANVEFIFSTWGMPVFNSEEIKSFFPSLKGLFYAAGSVQHFARPFIECGVRIFSSRAANAVPVAETTVAQIVLANKGYYLTARILREQGYSAAKTALMKCNGNYGETVGIIGAGMIGRLVIKILKNFQLNVLVYDPFLSNEDARELGVEKCELSSLFERAFVVSNHMANNEQTKGMLRYEHFSKMRENAVFINTGRGAQVVENDLIRVLKERYDLTALLDVTYPEPIAKEHPFLTLLNCHVTPHLAGSVGNEVARMGEYMVYEYEAFASGSTCKYEVTEKMLETMA
jgi:phosphoglycerate dehydrogenase-like enzyme